MATTVARLEAVLAADTSKFDRDMDQSEGKMGKVGKAAGVAGLAIAGGLAIGAKMAIDSASNLNEQLNKTSVVFGAQGDEVHKWSKGLAKDFGLSQRAALEAAGTYGNMLKPMGIAPKLVTKMSKSMVQLAGDMASFNNASPEETLRALGAGLAGETEPLRKFGVFLNEDTIAAEAMAMGLIKPIKEMGKITLQSAKVKEATQGVAKAFQEHGKGSEQYAIAIANQSIAEDKLSKLMDGKIEKLTAAQKAQASYGVIMKSTSDAQGDFANTSDSVANQQRIMKAQIEDLTAKLGMALLPVVQKVTGALLDMLGWLQKHPSAAKAMAVALGVLAAGLMAMSLATTLVAIGATAMWAALTAGLIIAIPALVAGFILLYKKSETFRDIVDAVIGVMRTLWAIFLNVTPIGLIIKHFDTLKESLERVVGVFQRIANWINRAYEHLKDFAGLLDKIKGPSGLDFLKGDPKSPNFMGPPGGGTGPTDISSRLWDELGGARRFGLTLTSGYRPGAVTRSGTPSDHGIYPSHAIDVAGAPSAMAGFFRWLIGQRDVKQAFYDPLGSIFGGMLSSYREGGHSDHVHVATADSGLLNLRPGWNMVGNFTGRNEPMSAGTTILAPIYIGGQHVVDVVFDLVRGKARVYERRNSRPAFGS